MAEGKKGKENPDMEKQMKDLLNIAVGVAIAVGCVDCNKECELRKKAVKLAKIVNEILSANER